MQQVVADSESVTALPSGLSIRFFREGDEEGILRLLQDAYGRWPRVDISVEPIEHLRWKLHSHEQASRFHIVAENDSRIVGVRLFLLSPVKVRDRLVLGHQSVDVAVHPDFREGGLSAAMQTHAYERFQEGLDFKLIGQSRHPALNKLRRRLGGELFGNSIESLTYPMMPWSRPPIRGLRVRGSLLKLADSFRLWMLRLLAEMRYPIDARADPAWTITQPAVFDERINEFWEEASRPFDFVFKRSDEFLNWRYCDRRSGRFAVKMAEQAGRVLGYVVLGTLRGKGQIADLLVLPGRDDVARSLVREAIARFRQQRAPAIRCWLPARHPYRDMLRRLGFVGAKRRDPPLGYRALKTPEAELEFLRSRDAAIHLTIGDTDFV